MPESTRYSDDYKFVLCQQAGCEAQRPNHAWGAVRAHEEGWFAQKNGQNWCPEHVPRWVEQWRAQQALKTRS